MEIDDLEYIPEGKQSADVDEQFFLPRDLLDYSELMDVPSVGNSQYFTFAPIRKHQHPTNPNTNGFISSRILPDGSNTIRFTTALGSDFTINEEPDNIARQRMLSEAFHNEYSGLDQKPKVVTHGEVLLTWKE
jgi:hypothetical protein